MDIVERELHLLMSQLSQEKPRVRKRKGNFKRSRLLKLREGSSHISLPSGIGQSPERPHSQELLGLGWSSLNKNPNRDIVRARKGGFSRSCALGTLKASRLGFVFANVSRREDEPKSQGWHRSHLSSQHLPSD